MAKAAKAEKPEVSKKQALEEYLTANPETSAKDAIEAMKKQGFDVSDSVVYNAKWVMNKAKEPTAKKAKAKRPAKVVEAAPAEAEVAAPEAPAALATPTGTKTAAVKAALKAHPKKQPKEIAELLQAEGWDVKAQLVSVVKSNMGAAKRKKNAATAPAPEAATPAVPKDAISIGLLQKAKKLAAQLGGIREAKAAIDALAQILD